MAAASTEVSCDTERGVRVIHIAGPFTFASLPSVQAQLRGERAPVTIVDLTAVPYADSAALGTLVAFHVSCERDGRRYGLAGLSPRFLKMLAVCQVENIFTLFPTLDEAREALQTSE